MHVHDSPFYRHRVSLYLTFCLVLATIMQFAIKGGF